MSAGAEQLSRSRIPFADEYYDRLVYERDTLGRFRIKPNQKLPHLSINALGYRGALFTGQETTLLLGDSVTFGIGAANDEARFARFWEQAANESIADASVRAYRVSQHYIQLPALLEQLPNLKRVAVWCGFADLLYWAIYSGRIDGTFQMDIKYSGVPRWKRWLTRFSKTSAQPISATPVEGDIPALARYMGRYLHAIYDLCRARNIAVQILLQPFIREQPKDETLRSITDYYDQSTQTKCGLGWYDAAQKLMTELKTGAQQRGIPLTDLQTWVDESDFFDQVHLKEAAHQRLAQKLARA
jgi:lysophospholipase L1-like esterase